MNMCEQLPFEAARDVEDVNLLKCTLYPTQPGGYTYVPSPACSSGVVGRILEQLTLGTCVLFLQVGQNFLRVRLLHITCSVSAREETGI